VQLSIPFISESPKTNRITDFEVYEKYIFTPSQTLMVPRVFYWPRIAVSFSSVFPKIRCNTPQNLISGYRATVAKVYYTKKMRRFSPLLVTLLLSGCLQLPNKIGPQCPSRDWYHEGQYYHEKGRSLRELQTAIALCKATGATVNTQEALKGYHRSLIEYCDSAAMAFQKGSRGEALPALCASAPSSTFYAAWDSGLRTYCVPDIGFALGRAGGQYNPICPKTLAPAFNASYQRGALVYQEITALREQTIGLRRRLHEMKDLEKNNRTLLERESLINSHTPEIIHLRDRALILENQRTLIENELFYLEGKILRSEVEK
jgi:hypothetical protein